MQSSRSLKLRKVLHQRPLGSYFESRSVVPSRVVFLLVFEKVNNRTNVVPQSLPRKT